MKNFLKYFLMAIGVLALLAVAAWIVMSVVLIRKVSTVHSRAENIAAERIMKKPLKVEADQALPKNELAPIVEDELRDFETIKDDPVKSGYLYSRIVVFSRYAMKTRENQNLRPLCSLVCDASLFDEAQADKTGPLYLEDFLLQHGERAFEDFYFRHFVEGMNLLSHILGEDMLNAIMDAYKATQNGAITQAALAVKMNYYVARFANRFSGIEKDMEIFFNEMKEIDGLKKMCGQKSYTEIEERCEALFNSATSQRLRSKFIKDE